MRFVPRRGGASVKTNVTAWGAHDSIDSSGRRGAPINGGQAVGLNAEEQPTSNHDIHASVLYLMGMDHKKLTYYFNGRNMRLTDVAGELIPQITGTPKKA